jgi:hypothetical protein
MKDPASEAGRQLNQARWGARKPIRLAHEVAARASELPDAERVKLIAVLQNRQMEKSA